MKVYIGPYRSWIGPFQIAEKILWWKSNDDPLVDSLGNWLAYGKWTSETWGNHDKTLFYKFCLWLNNAKNRKISIHIDNYDTWDMDRTLSFIILPMLKQLQQTKQGWPHVDDEDVPEYLKTINKSVNVNKDEITDEIDDNYRRRWEYVIAEMIFAFEHKIDTYNKFCSVVKDENNMDTLTQTLTPDDTRIKQRNERINNGLRLFGKYYNNLWD
jgi:hypothetical protein